MEEKKAVPEFTLRADSMFGIRAMIAVNEVASRLLPREEAKVIATKLREFDLYEEAVRSSNG